MAEFNWSAQGTANSGSHHESNRLRAEGLGYLQLFQAEPPLYLIKSYS